MTEMNTGDKIINHLRNVKLLEAIHGKKKFYVECSPTDEGARCFPNSNFAVKEIELPIFELYEEKLGYKWVKHDNKVEFLKERLEFYFRNYYTNLLGNSQKTNELWKDFKQTNAL